MCARVWLRACVSHMHRYVVTSFAKGRSLNCLHARVLCPFPDATASPTLPANVSLPELHSLDAVRFAGEPGNGGGWYYSRATLGGVLHVAVPAAPVDKAITLVRVPAVLTSRASHTGFILFFPLRCKAELVAVLGEAGAMSVCLCLYLCLFGCGSGACDSGA